MEGGSSFGGCHDMLSLLENPNNLWLPSSSPFNETMMNFDQEPPQAARVTLKRNRNDGPFMRTSDGEDDAGEEESELNLLHSSEKKRRLTSEQVKFLEKSFGEENKLEPDRKVELAKQLGLQPRQVAIWFQNRRARYKTKQIEKEYDALKANYERLKNDYDCLYKEKEFLKNEVQVLTKKLGDKERNEANLNYETILQFEELTPGMGLQGVAYDTNSGDVLIPCTKQVEDASSAKSDIFDSESPPCADNANQSSSALVVEASSTLMRELDQQSDFSQEDEEHLLISNNLLLPQTPPTFNNFLKVTEDGNFSLADDDQSSFWSWLY